MKYTLIHARSESGDDYYHIEPDHITDADAAEFMDRLAADFGDTVWVNHVERGELSDA